MFIEFVKFGRLFLAFFDLKKGETVSIQEFKTKEILSASLKYQKIMQLS